MPVLIFWSLNPREARELSLESVSPSMRKLQRQVRFPSRHLPDSMRVDVHFLGKLDLLVSY